MRRKVSVSFGWYEANDARLATDSQAMGITAGRIDDQPQPFGRGPSLGPG
jgi:hypothetical protein